MVAMAIVSFFKMNFSAKVYTVEWKTSPKIQHQSLE